MANGAASASQNLRQLIRREQWLAAKSAEMRQAGRNSSGNDAELEAIRYAIPLVAERVEMNARNHESGKRFERVSDALTDSPEEAKKMQDAFDKRRAAMMALAKGMVQGRPSALNDFR